MNKKLAAVFPYDMDFEPVLRHTGLCDMVSVKYLVAPEGCIIQKQVAFCGKEYMVKEELTPGEMEQVELLWLADSYYQISEETILQRVKIFAERGKNILAGREMDGSLRERVQNICRESEVQFLEPCVLMKDYHPAERELLEGPVQVKDVLAFKMQQIMTPVIIVLGDGERCDKFELQLSLREQMLKNGYKVCSVGSRKGCEMLGIYSHPGFMGEEKFLETEKIICYNNYIKKLEMLEQPDVFILGIPGGILPLTQKLHGDFGIRAYEIFHAVSPDYLVFSMHLGEYNQKYLTEMRQLFHYRFHAEIDSFFISNWGIDSYSLQMGTWLKYLYLPKEKVREAIEGIGEACDVFSLQEIEKIGENALDKLSEYAEAEIV